MNEQVYHHHLCPKSQQVFCESYVPLEYLEINQISFEAKIMLNKSFLNPLLLHLYLLCQSLNRMSDYISTGLQVNMLSVKVYIAKLYPADA